MTVMKTDKNHKSPKKETLLSNIEQVVNLVIDKKLGDEFYTAADTNLSYLAERMEITKEQALVFSLFMEKSCNHRIRMSDFADMIKCRMVQMVTLMGEADKLSERGFVQRHKNSSDIYYTVPIEVVEAVKEDRVYIPAPLTGLTSEAFLDRLDKIFDSDAEYDDEFQLDTLLVKLISANPQLPFCQVVKRYGLTDCSNWSVLLLCVFVNRLVNHDDDMIAEHDWEDYFRLKGNLRWIRQKIKSGTHPLCSNSLVEPHNNDGMEDTRYFHLTDAAKREMFPELDLCDKQHIFKELTPYSSFTAKPLFYNGKVQAQIEQLALLLMPEQFDKVAVRLAENGMRRGFACLFHGAPGTGKTETVNQLARKTGRDVMMVDVSKIKSCWVGESEKNIKAAFDRYRRFVQQSKVAPILLFNEADSILGIRREGAERSVDKMENSVQNIILQEMEQLEGIMIATTNLTRNLDKAFERRFIYKIEFERPSLETKQAIWQTMIPSMDAPTARLLATQYDFSGGQIENVARKRAVEMILTGQEPSLSELHAYCRAESLSDRAAERRRIGF